MLGGRPASAMADYGSSTASSSLGQAAGSSGEQKESWLKRNFIGRTPSLPSSLGKKRQSFLKKFHCRKISAPSFASTLKQSPLVKPSSVVVQNEPQTMTPDPSIGSLEDVGSSCKCDPGGLFCAPKLLSTDLSISSVEEALSIIESLRSKYHCLGQQTLAYRQKLRQQKVEMGLMEAEHKRQLEDISAQLMQFEASLRAKERQIEKTISSKDQVIDKQQKVIKKLLKKREANTQQSGGEESGGCQPRLAHPVPRIITGFDDNHADDNMVVGEVSIPVPNLNQSNSADNEEQSCAVSTVTAAADAATKAATDSSGLEANNKLNGRKTKEERRISNRQKLLSLKRHSGYLKRPEILETVYSVEEDTENAQQQIQQQQQLQQQRQKKAEEERENYFRKGSPGCARRPSSSNAAAPLVFLAGGGGFRKRLDSDMTTYSDCSTDDESTRLVFSETESAATGCSYSQPCSRRSSTGGSVCCHCMQAASGTSISAPASRRSSCGSMTTNALIESYNKKLAVLSQTANNKRAKRRVLEKARSLEELRGRLQDPSMSSSTNEDDLEEFEEDDDDDTAASSSGASANRISHLRQMMRLGHHQQRSLSLDQESTDVSTN